MFNESTDIIHTISFDLWYTDRKAVRSGSECQVDIGDIGSAQNNNSPKNLKTAHQCLARIDVPNKNIIITIFDNLNVRKYFVEIDGYRSLMLLLQAMPKVNI